MEKIKLVVFDLDGTIVEEKSSWRKVHEFFGTENKSDENMKLYEDGKISYEEFVIRDLKAWPTGISKKVFEYVLNRIKLKNGVDEVIREIKRRGKRTAILSSGISLLAERISRELEIDYYVANEIVFDENEKSIGKGIAKVELKNKSKALLELLSRINIDRKEVLGVGDSKFDLDFLKMCGYSVLIRDRKEELEASVNFIIDDIKEIVKVIDIIEEF